MCIMLNVYIDTHSVQHNRILLINMVLYKLINICIYDTWRVPRRLKQVVDLRKDEGC